MSSFSPMLRYFLCSSCIPDLKAYFLISYKLHFFLSKYRCIYHCDWNIRDKRRKKSLMWSRKKKPKSLEIWNLWFSSFGFCFPVWAWVFGKSNSYIYTHKTRFLSILLFDVYCSTVLLNPYSQLVISSIYVKITIVNCVWLKAILNQRNR